MTPARAKETPARHLPGTGGPPPAGGSPSYTAVGRGHTTAHPMATDGSRLPLAQAIADELQGAS